MSKRIQSPPIFVVGAPRSGTTLLAAMINAHRRLACGNETHFFAGLQGAIVDYLIDRRHWPRRALEYVCRLAHVGRTVLDLYQVDVGAYSAALARSRPAVSSILDCLMAGYLVRVGKSRWAEKTPGHLKRFAIIREHFPNSPVICLFRDPRDVARSLMKVPWSESTFYSGLLTWKSYCEYYKRLIMYDRRSMLLRFEDLIEDRLAACQRICAFVGEDFDPGMLDTSHSAIAVGSELEPYKSDVAEPVDPGRAFAWRKDLRECDRVLADSMLGRDLLWLGYPLAGMSRSAGDGEVGVRAPG
jgi:Sulfotransferase family